MLDFSVVSPTRRRQLGRNLVLECAEKYAHAIRAMAPLALTFSSSEIVPTLQAFHLSVSPSPYPNSLMAFQLDEDLMLFLDSFRLTFMGMSHLFTRGPSSMVFQRLQNAFDLKDFASSSIQLHQLNSHIITGHFPEFITHVLCAARLLALAKPSNAII
jgi:hypothetical protein